VVEGTIERRLAAIMVADVVGYSRLMDQDEAATLSALKERWKSVLGPVISAHAGRTVKMMGDGALVEFASAVNAVAAALDLQSKMAEANRELPEARHVVLRIGINLGDVVGEGADIYGEGVNIAARLEALAEPGGICISAKVHDELHGKIAAASEDMGELQLKNIARPVRAYRVGPAPASRNATSAGPARKDSKPSIAVLPFTNMSGDPEQEYFSDGITEDIIRDFALPRSHRHRAKLFLCLQGCPRQRRQGRARTGRCLRSGRKRSALGQSGADHRSASRCADWKPHLGRAL
jgi:class 3 adenylate cyclase